MTTCPTCGATMDESHLGDKTAWNCPECGFAAYTEKELRLSQELLAAKNEIVELQNRLDQLVNAPHARIDEANTAERKLANADKKIYEQKHRLLVAGADAERLSAVLMNTVNFFVGDANVLAVLEQHDMSAKVYKGG